MSKNTENTEIKEDEKINIDNIDIPTNLAEVSTLLIIITPLIVRYAIKPAILASNFVNAMSYLLSFLPWFESKVSDNPILGINNHQKNKLYEKIREVVNELQLNWGMIGILHNGEISDHGYHLTKIRWECIYFRLKEPPWKNLDDPVLISRKAYKISTDEDENTRPDYIFNEYIYHLPIYKENLILGVITIGSYDFIPLNKMNNHIEEIRKFIEDCII
jgi:hypothetical protein